jgi:ribonucleoside-diphosphate reductase beta chain
MVQLHEFSSIEKTLCFTKLRRGFKKLSLKLYFLFIKSFVISMTTPTTPYFETSPLDQRLQLLLPNGNYFRPDIAQMAASMESCLWPANEVALSKDILDYEKINEDEKQLLDTILGLFASFDGMVNRDVITQFKIDIPFAEAKMFYALQECNENVHNVMYGRLITQLNRCSTDKTEKLIDAITHIEPIKALAGWLREKLDAAVPLPIRLIVAGLIEGPIFQSNFAIIGKFRDHAGAFPGLIQSNDLIARDEYIHLSFSALMYSKLLPQHKLSEQTVRQLYAEVKIMLSRYNEYCLPNGIPGINNILVDQYVEYYMNLTVKMFGYDAIYPQTTNPFTWMNSQGLEEKVRFFERNSGNYSKHIESSDDPYANMKKRK